MGYSKISNGTELYYAHKNPYTNIFVQRSAIVLKDFISTKDDHVWVSLDKPVICEDGVKKQLKIPKTAFHKSLFISKESMKIGFENAKTEDPDFVLIKEKQKFFETRVKMNGEPFKLDDEQAWAVLAPGNAIVTARAGSGKTRVLTAKLIDLFVNQDVKKDEALAFCFNRDAAEEIRRRLNSECIVDGVGLFQNCNDVVKTFHAFALNVIDKSEEILVDNQTSDRTALIKEIINDLRINNKNFEDNLVKYFIKSTLKIDHRNFETKEAYYKFMRNARYETLNGEHVRSINEKYIADFLFEYGIEYKYERTFYINYDEHTLEDSDAKRFKAFLKNKRKTTPDFYLTDYNIVWEHWGITGKENTEAKEKFSKMVGNYNEYKTNMENKKAFWNCWRHELVTTNQKYDDFLEVEKLIETNPDFFASKSRDEIEQALKAFLESNGVVCKRRPDKELMDEVWQNAQDGFTHLMVQFIDKYQQKFIDQEDAFIALAKNVENDREKTFLRLGYLVYQEYIKTLNGKSNKHPKYKRFHMDFNQCLNMATQKILSGEYDDRIKQLRWLLIDEYQDFSKLFFDLVDAIRKRNENIMVFCVGDDWQAINRFAGSDLKYFSEFKKYFPNSRSYSVNKNYRSDNRIVSFAQDFMTLTQDSQKILDDSDIVRQICIEEKAFYKNKKKTAMSNESTDNVNEEESNPYIEYCAKIIKENFNKRIFILIRTNRFFGKDLKAVEIDIKKEVKKIFEQKLERKLKASESKKIDLVNVKVKTVHKAKGEEADVVIIPGVDEGYFPLFNSDSHLFSVFEDGKTLVLDDEKRLYYVALTRAKQLLYILYSEKSPSNFVKNPT